MSVLRVGYRRSMTALYGRWTVLQAHLRFGIDDRGVNVVKYFPRAWQMRRRR